jgi:hypothetical protein
MYHTQHNPLHRITRGSAPVETVRGSRQRKLHKAFLRYHDAENWPLLRDALRQMGRADLIGNSKKQLIPSFQPAGTSVRRRDESAWNIASVPRSGVRKQILRNGKR